MKIAIASDHVGYDLKVELVKYLASKNKVVDLGTNDSTTSVDYPDYAKKVTGCVVSEKDCFGILICGTGIGMCITANKVKGVRAANVYDTFSAKMAKTHNNANIICIGSRVLDVSVAVEVVDTWLNEEFEGGRHSKRLNKITEIEREG